LQKRRAQNIFLFKKPYIYANNIFMKRHQLTAFVLLLFVFSACKKTSLNSVSTNGSVNLKTTTSGNLLSAAVLAGSPKKFLFDATKAETAGNADWVIDEDNNSPKQIPTPAQSNITSSTSESYWTGALSSWGIGLVKLGQTVETLPSGKAITYGSTTNAQDLSKYDVFIVDEPNTRFTTAEKTAIVNFVKNGGGLFMISDHTVSDRNNDGWDSPDIWNDLMTTNSVQSNPFGFKIDLTNISQTSTNVTTVSNPITNGTVGNVVSLKFSNGATATLTSGSAAQGLVWKTGSSQGLTNLLAAYSTYGTGRVVVICDSSPADDGTGASGNTLFPGWTENGSNHSNFHLNGSLWLAKLQ
jgi:hypothetical protein